MIKTIRQQRGKMNESLLMGWEKGTIKTKTVISTAEINVATLCGQVHLTRRRSKALGEEEMTLICHATRRAVRRSGGGEGGGGRRQRSLLEGLGAGNAETGNGIEYR